MLSKLLLIALCICSLSATPSALDCNWMSCYATELKDCSVVAYKDECPTGVFVVYKEAPLFFSKRKCCKELTLEKAKEMYLCKYLAGWSFVVTCRLLRIHCL